MLLDRGADVNAQGGEYGNALYAASFGGHENVVSTLIERGADVNAQGGYYGNVLHAPTSLRFGEPNRLRQVWAGLMSTMKTLVRITVADVSTHESTHPTPHHSLLVLDRSHQYGISYEQCRSGTRGGRKAGEITRTSTFQDGSHVEGAQKALEGDSNGGLVVTKELERFPARIRFELGDKRATWRVVERWTRGGDLQRIVGRDLSELALKRGS